MPIYYPRPQMSEREQRLAILLLRLLEEHMHWETGSNLPEDRIALSTRDREELIELLAAYLDSRQFFYSLSFIDALDELRTDESMAREIYLSGRILRGRTRTMASKQWAEFLARFLERDEEITHPYQPWRPGPVGMMSLEYFAKMEEKLLHVLGATSEVSKYVISIVNELKEHISRFRSPTLADQNIEAYNTAKAEISNILRALKDPNLFEIPPKKVAALSMVVADSSVLFATRDWSVAGTISTFAGAFATLTT